MKEKIAVIKTLASIEKPTLTEAKVICAGRGIRLVDYITEAVKKENNRQKK